MYTYRLCYCYIMGIQWGTYNIYIWDVNGMSVYIYIYGEYEWDVNGMSV